MTSIVNQVTLETIANISFERLSATIGVIVIALLVSLLVTREMFKVYDDNRGTTRLRVFNIAIMPLLMSFSVIMVVRFVHILG